MNNYINRIMKLIKVKSIEVFLFLTMIVSLTKIIPNSDYVVFSLQILIVLLSFYFLTKGEKTIVFPINILLFIFLFSLLLFISFLINGNKIVIIKVNILSYIYSLFLLFLLMVDTRDFKKVISSLSLMFMVMGGIITLYSMLTYVFGTLTYFNGNSYFIVELTDIIKLPQLVFGSPNNFRFSSIYYNPNTYGKYMFIILAFNLSRIIENENKIDKENVINLIFFVVNFIGLLSTKSRTSIFSFLIFVVGFVFLSLIVKINIFQDFFRSNKYIIYLIIISILIIIFIVFNFVQSRRGVFSTNSRVLAWSKTFDIFKENPIFGIGNGNLNLYLKNTLNLNHAHNSFLEILSENGIFLFFLYLYIWYKSFKNIVEIYLIKIKLIKLEIKEEVNIKKQYNAGILILLISLLSAIFIHQFFESNLFTYDFVNFITIVLLYYSYEITINHWNGNT